MNTNENKEFFQFVGNVLKKAEDDVALIDEYAEIALCIKEKLKPTLLNYIKSNDGSKEIKMPLSEIIKGEQQYDLRQEMDSEITNQIALLGYCYCIEESKPNELVFKRGE